MFRKFLVRLYAAMNSASVEEPATVGWNLVLKPTVPPTKLACPPVKDF